MKNSEIYRLRGFIEIFPVKVGFVTPVFLKDNELFVESASQGTIDHFEPLPEQYKNLVELEKRDLNLELKKEDNCYYGFKWDGNVHYGDSKTLADILANLKFESDSDR